jgi:hypothetical protein
MPRVGSFALALAGRTIKLHEAFFGVAGRRSFALERIIRFAATHYRAAGVTPDSTATSARRQR